MMNDLDEKDLLARELRERSQDVGGHPIDFAAVRGSARAIRRRRNLVSGAVAAMVASVALPTGLAITSGLTTAEGPVEQPSFATSPSSTPTSSTPDGPVRLDLDGLERGADPTIGYLYRDELVLPAGRVQLEKEYQEIAPLGDGWVGLANDEGSWTRDFIDADGDVTNSLPSEWGLAVDLDRSQVAFTQIENGDWNILDVTVDGMEPRSPLNTASRPVRPVGYAGDGVLVYIVGEGEETSVRVFEPSAEDYEVPADPRLITATGTSESEGLVSGMTESRLGGSCWAVVSYRTGNQTMNTCDHALGSFSSDGRHVIGTPADGDGAGPRSLAVLDAHDGDVVVEFEQPRNGQMFLGDPVWEDDEHVLATVTDGLEVHVVRFGTDGSMELASDTVTADDYDLPPPIKFMTQP